MFQLNLIFLIFLVLVLGCASNPGLLLISLVSGSVIIFICLCLGGNLLGGYIFFLVYVGGLLVLIFYLMSLFSKVSIKTQWSFKWILLSIIMLDLLFDFSVSKDGRGLDYLFFGGGWLSIFFVAFFVVSLWLVFKMNIISRGCLRPFY